MNNIARITLRLSKVSKGQGTRRPLFPAARMAAASTRIINNSINIKATTTNTRNSSTSTNGSMKSNSMDATKTALARAALEQVPKHGWTQDAITAAASRDPKLSISMSGMLSASELVGWFMDDMNHELRAKKRENDNTSSNTSDADAQFEAIRWRLEQVLPFVESGQWHRGMAMGLSTPLETRSRLHEFIELVAPPGAGPAHHTALGAIFVATELHLLTDGDSGYEATWSFLRERLDELESHRRQNGGAVDPAGFVVKLAASVPVPSLSSLANATNSIPVVAGLAVAQSLVEGAASLVFPGGGGVAVSPANAGAGSTSSSSFRQPEAIAGTKVSDYESPSSSPSKP